MADAFAEAKFYLLPDILMKSNKLPEDGCFLRHCVTSSIFLREKREKKVRKSDILASAK